MPPEEMTRYDSYWNKLCFKEFSNRTSGVINEIQMKEAYDALKSGDYSKMTSYFNTYSPKNGAVF